MMISRALPFLLGILLMLSSCASNTSTETLTADISTGGEPETLGYDFVIFDSDGDGTKDDFAELTCLGMSGGYGSFRIEVFISGENSYRKVFDSEQYKIDESVYKNLSEKIDGELMGELMIDTFYLVEAADTDEDGCEELICRQYSWEGCHSNHIGDIVTTLKMTDNVIKIIEVRFESLK